MSATSATSTLSTKGQVTLPKAVRDQLHWEAGTRLTVVLTPDGVFLKPLTTTFAPTRPEDVFGCLGHKGRPRSVEEMGAGGAMNAKRPYASTRI